MNTGLLIATVAFAGIIFLRRFFKAGDLRRKTIQFVAGSSSRYAAEDLPQDEVWWTQLDTLVQLELAVALARKALPVWQRYSEGNDLSYKNSPIGSPVAIPTLLLQTSLDEISQQSQHRFPENSKGIMRCYNDFIAPLVALQDGHWSLTYPVKKIFLSVYNLLKAVTEQDNISVMKHLLALSINQSLDCLDMCRLYSRDEIKAFLHSYRVQPA